MPTKEHIAAMVAKILDPFSEHTENNANGFWDFYSIGGRFAGNHLMAGLDPKQMDAFQDALQKMKVTVSGLQCGKQELSPKSQIPKVDKLWAKFFPDQKGQPCPLFNHSNDQYDRDGNGQLPEDVIHFRDVPRDHKCSRVIVAGPDHKGESMEAEFMISEDNWNGVNHVKSDWDHTIGGALNMHMDRINGMIEEAQAKYSPTDNWLVVTVDYHS